MQLLCIGQPEEWYMPSMYTNTSMCHSETSYKEGQQQKAILLHQVPRAIRHKLTLLCRAHTRAHAKKSCCKCLLLNGAANTCLGALVCHSVSTTGCGCVKAQTAPFSVNTSAAVDSAAAENTSCYDAMPMQAEIRKHQRNRSKTDQPPPMLTQTCGTCAIHTHCPYHHLQWAAIPPLITSSQHIQLP